ncbi:MAG: TolC family protein [Bryobacterales bacterium]|nr:TolC family protein [Bryobacterales bacterium]
MGWLCFRLQEDFVLAYWLIAALVLGALLPCRAQGPPVGWRELYQHAAANDQRLMALQEEVSQARGVLRQAGLRPATEFSVSGATGRPLGTLGEEQFGAAVSRALEASGKRSGRLAVAEYGVALAEANYQEGLRQLRYALRLQYSLYGTATHRLQIAEEVMQSWQRSLDLVAQRVEQGDASSLERNLIRVELARAKAECARLRGTLEKTRVELALLSTYDDPRGIPDPEISVPELLDISLNELRSQALQQRPDLHYTALSERQAESGVSLAKAEGKPDWTLSAGYTNVYSRFDNQLGLDRAGGLATLRDRDDLLVLGVTVPILGARRNQGNLEAASARMRGAQHRSRALSRSIPLQVDAAWGQYTGARESYETLTNEVLVPASENLQVIRQAYELGHLEMLDLLNEQRRFYSLRMEAVDLQLSIGQAMAELEFALGGELP